MQFRVISRSRRLNKKKKKKRKEGFLTGFATAIKDPTMSIRKHANPIDYTIWGVLKNITNAITHLNIGLHKTAIEEERIKMSEKFIWQTCKSFRMRVDTMIE